MWNPSQIHGPFFFPRAKDAAGNVTDFFPGYFLLVDPALMAADLQPHQINAPPPVEWAGQPSVYLQFDDEAGARATSLGAHWIESLSPTVDDIRTTKKLAIDAQLEAAFMAGFTIPSGPAAGKVLQVRDVTDRTNWLASKSAYRDALAAGMGDQPGATFRTMDNATVTMTFTEGYAVLQAMGVWAAGLMANSWHLKDEVATAPDPSSVDVTAGWHA